MELRTVNGKKQYGYLKKPLKDMLDFIVDELEKMPEVATYYSIWNDLRDTLESYYKSRSGQAQSAFAAERISQQSRTSLFKKRRICAFSSKILLHRLLQIRHLQVKILYPQLLTKRAFHPNIF